MVNTSAMTGGMARTPAERAFFAQGPEVSHFNYFANPKTADSWSKACCVPTTPMAASSPCPLPRFGVVPTAARRGGAESGRSSSSCPALPAPSWPQGPACLDRPAAARLRRPAAARDRRARHHGEGAAVALLRRALHLFGLHTRRSPVGLRLAPLDPRQCVATSAPSWVMRWRPPTSRCGSSPTRWAAWSPARPSWTPSSGKRFQDRPGSRLIQLGTPNGGSWSIPYMLMGRDTMMGYPRRARLHHVPARAAGGRCAFPGRSADASARRCAAVRRSPAGRPFRSSTRATRTGCCPAPTILPSQPASATPSPRPRPIPSACSTLPATRLTMVGIDENPAAPRGPAHHAFA